METEVRVKSFLQKRDKLLTVIGAFIVFATFLLKEGAKEHLKEVADSRAAVENTYISSETLRYSADVQLSYEIRDAINTLPEGTWNLTGEKQDRAHLELLSKLLPLVPKYISSTEYELRELATIVQKLDEPYGVGIGVIREWKQLQALEALYDKMPHLAPQELLDKKNENEATEVLRQAREAYPALIEFTNDIGPMRRAVLTESAREKKQAEDWYRWSKWASYLFYTIGWGLGLIGKIYGVGGVAAGE
jgi:hypothetical protein